MVENVTDIIVSRSRESEGMRTMLVWSIAGHIGLVAVSLLWSGPRAEPQREVMVISLGGAEGPKTGGINQIASGQSVQAPAPPEVKPVEAPPAPKPPEMTLPDARPRARPQPKPKQAPPEATGRTVSTGEVPREGPTRERGKGFNTGTGLSSSGGGGAGPVTLDVTDFCCYEYIEQMVILVRQSWDQNQGVVGSTTMQFTIVRNGAIQSPQVEKSSGFVVLDNAATRALQVVRLPPLPQAFPNPTLTVHLRFDYQR
jgi:protein TonB